MNNSSYHVHKHLVQTPPVSVPALTFVITVMSLGVIGNGLVLMVYGHKLQKPSNYRSFVLMLAGIDMASCCIGMPGILVGMLNPSSLFSDTTCKLLHLITHGIVSASAMTHLLIGIERHRKICKPLKKQLTTRGSKVVLMAIVLLSFIISLPAYMIYGKCQFEIKEKNTTVAICTITKTYAQTSLPAIYESSLFSLQVLTVLALLVMYILIARRIWKTKRAIQPFLKRFSKGVNRNEARTQILRSVTEHFSDFKSSIHSRLGRACHRKSKVQSTTNRRNASTSGEENRINAIELTRKQENDSCDGESNTAVPIHFICDPNPSAKTIPPQVKNEEIDVSEVFQSKVSDYNDTTETVSTRTQISKLSRKEARTQIFQSVIGHFSEFKSRIYSSLGKAFHCKSRSASSRTNTSTSDEQNRMNAIEMSMNQENDSCDGESKTVVGINFIYDPNHSEKKIPPSVNEENDVSEVFQSRISDYNDTMETASTRTQINRLSREQTTSTKSVKKHSRKVTAVSCAITFVFIISYVPYFVVVWASVEGRRDVHMTPTEEALYRICGLSYIINNAANSFVYYLMDNDFRAKCKQCICRCFMKP